MSTERLLIARFTAMRMPKVSAVVCVLAILLITLYSAFTADGVIAANAPPTVAFTLGTAHRDVTHCNSQTLDIYIPSVPAARPLPLATSDTTSSS